MTESGSEIPIEIIRSRRRSISIRITAGSKVIVRAPLYLSERKILAFVTEKKGWIEKHLNSAGLRNNKATVVEYRNGSALPWGGRMIPLAVEPGRKGSMVLSDNLFIIFAKDPDDISANRKTAEKWYKTEALKSIEGRLNEKLTELSPYGFRVSHLTVRRMKSRWGSCSSTGKITLNSMLVLLPPECLDYVIVHELCHLLHRNHGKQFYELLEEIVPDYKKVRKTLKEWQWILTAV